MNVACLACSLFVLLMIVTSLAYYPVYCRIGKEGSPADSVFAPTRQRPRVLQRPCESVSPRKVERR
jgi:hypothetical protein